MISKKSRISGKRAVSVLLATTMLTGVSSVAAAQNAAETPAAPTASVPVPAVAATSRGDTIRSITVVGSQRLEADTVRSYIRLRVGQLYTQEKADNALKELFATELFSDVNIRNASGAVVITVQENPVINRIILEGNKRIKSDKIEPEIRLAPRQIFTRSKVRADVARIIELYKRKGRFAANVEPKMVQLDQNRVDIVFEIVEGPRSKVRQINIIGNDIFSDGKLQSEMVTKQSRFYRFFSSADSYDPDKLAFDQQKLRQFYLTEGYADFRVISAVAELTPDKQDFIITYVVEEGERYKFGEVKVESDIRDFKPVQLQNLLPMKSGDFYDAKSVEDTVERLSETAGLFGYAFADVRPQFRRDKETLTMNITFQVADAPRVYVEAIEINGNTLTQDKVVRREFRLNEGDAFNSFQVKRSANRIKSLGFFQEDLEIQQKPGSAPDRVILQVDVEENPTGELQLSAGFSSIESFILQASIKQRNFRGRAQEIRTSVNVSRFSKSIELGFTEPSLFDKNLAVGFDIFRRDLNSFNQFNNSRVTTFQQSTTGFQIRVGAALNEYLSLSMRYGLNYDKVTLDRNTFFADRDGDGIFTCDPLLAGRFLCDNLGNRITSSIGYSLIYDDRNNRVRPTRGQQVVFSQDFAGLGGSVKYLRNRLNFSKHHNLGLGFIANVSAEFGYIKSFENRGNAASGIDNVRLSDRFFLGEPQIRGFDIRGVGPRVLRVPTTELANLDTYIEQNRDRIRDDAIGGRAYYLARLEIDLPLGNGARELGLRPTIFADVGSVFGVRTPQLQSINVYSQLITDANGAPVLDANMNQQFISVQNAVSPTGAANTLIPGQSQQEVFLGNSSKPRVSIGIGVNWNSPFGPFRIDLAKAIKTQRGDDTKLFSFNVGTQF